MCKRSGIVAAALIAGTLWTGGFHAALAQNATPDIPQPAECTVAPIPSVDPIVAIWNAEDYAPDPQIAAGVLPTGAPASDEVTQAVAATLRQLIACSNAGDWARQLAVMTPHGTLFFAPNDQVTAGQLTGFFAGVLATPIPAAQYESDTGVTNVIMLADGRVGAISPAQHEDGKPVYVIFVEQDGSWLIDDIIEIIGTGTPEASPPA